MCRCLAEHQRSTESGSSHLPPITSGPGPRTQEHMFFSPAGHITQHFFFFFFKNPPGAQEASWALLLLEHLSQKTDMVRAMPELHELSTLLVTWQQPKHTQYDTFCQFFGVKIMYFFSYEFNWVRMQSNNNMNNIPYRKQNWGVPIIYLQQRRKCSNYKAKTSGHVSMFKSSKGQALCALKTDTLLYSLDLSIFLLYLFYKSERFTQLRGKNASAQSLSSTKTAPSCFASFSPQKHLFSPAGESWRLSAQCTHEGPPLTAAGGAVGQGHAQGLPMEQPHRKPSSCLRSPAGGSGVWLLNPWSSNGLSSRLEALRAGCACHGTSAWWGGWCPVAVSISSCRCPQHQHHPVGA